jgi:glycosyltransferase involved in cell wall biosynthesis
VFKKIIEKAIEEHNPDIIMTHHLWLMTSLAVEVSIGKPVLAFCHGTDIRQMKKGCRYKNAIVEGCRKVSTIFALSEEQKKDIVDIYRVKADKVEVIGGGFDNEKFYLPQKMKKKEKVRLIYVGKLSYAKGVKSLIKVYSKLKGDLELTLVGCGEGSEGEHILRLVEKIDKDINLKGQLSQEELSEVFREGDIFVLPSYYEGLSLVTIEALASGLRVVVSEIESLKGYLGDKINRTGIIEYVKLPRMKNVDEPLEEDLDDFEDSLFKAIEVQIEERLSELDFEKFEEVYEEIKSKSWSDIAMKIDKKIEEIELN